MLSYADFVKKYTGVRCGNTADNMGQCVGLVALWVDNLGLSHIWGNACDLYSNSSDKEWLKIPNTPTNVPVAGDIMVWKPRTGDPAGHTALFMDGNVMFFYSFDQNYPNGGEAPHRQYHTYGNLIGWLRPIDPLKVRLDKIQAILNANLSNVDKLSSIKSILA